MANKGVDVQVRIFVEGMSDPQWEVAQWMSGASAQELRTAVAEVQAKYPNLPIRCLRNGKVVKTPS